MKGVDVSRADCVNTGLIGDGRLPDRVWMVTTASYNYVTSRQQSRLSTVQPSLHGDWLHLDAPGMNTIKLQWSHVDNENQIVLASVWGEKIEVVDCGDEVSSWICSYLNKPIATYRLVYHLPKLAKRRCDHGPTRWHKAAKADDMVVFQDGFPFMLMSEASVEDLNNKLEVSCRQPVTMNHFRPNIVATDTLPFDEDDWDELFIGDATFTNIKPCQRCVMTTVNPETGEKRPDNEPLVALRRYRLLEQEFGNSPCLGINLVVNRPGTIHIGDEILAIRKTH
jgi:uncharacterized protein YcbX